MRSCENCLWRVGVFKCQKRRDTDGDMIEIKNLDGVCEQYERQKCVACSNYQSDGSLCTAHTNSLGNYIEVKRDGLCDNFNRNIRWGTSLGRADAGSGCFLTSACVDYYGKDDDCYELTTLRKLRDEHLVNLEGGKELIVQYYDIAPRIVKKIDASSERSDYYEYIYKNILKCIEFYENGEYEEGIKNYKDMVKLLKEELCDV